MSAIVRVYLNGRLKKSVSRHVGSLEQFEEFCEHVCQMCRAAGVSPPRITVTQPKRPPGSLAEMAKQIQRLLEAGSRKRQ